MTTDEKPGLWTRLDRPTKVVAAIAVAIGALVGAVATGAAFFGGTGKTVVVEAHTTATPNSGQRIAKCMSAHHLRAARVTIGDPNVARLVVFKRCDWPAIFEGSADGYTQVSAHLQRLSKPDAARYNYVATFRAPCDEIDVTFILDQMAARIFSSRRLERGRVYEVEFLSDSSIAVRRLNYVPNDVLKLVAPPGGNQGFYVLYSGHFAVFDAHCSAGPPPH